MAGIKLMATTAEVTLSTATAKTVLQLIAPTNQRLVLKRWAVFFDASSPSLEPVQVVLMRQTTAGTMSALTPTKTGVYTETIQSTAQHTATAEPTSGDILDVAEVHPQSGYEVIFPLGDEIIIPGGGRLGIVCTAPVGVNVRAKFGYEE